MKNIKTKKGFTIVELIIVIAVIAVLAAVLIPTFITVVKKAKISADTAVAKNMNTALATAEVTGGKNKTFYDAMQDILDAGYSLEKLTPTSENALICWDQNVDRIVFIDADGKVLFSDDQYEEADELWAVAHTENDLNAYTANYNLYLADNFPLNTVNVSRGLDVGDNTGIVTINYSNFVAAQTVIIRTNGGTLNINAPLDTINHYGTALTVNVEAVAMSSLIECGKVLGNINLKKGHVKLTSSAEVGVVQVAPEATNNVKLTGEGGATLGTLDINPTATFSTGTMTLDLSGVTCSSIVKNEAVAAPSVAGTTIVATTLTSTQRENADDYSGGLGTETSPYIVTTEAQLGNALNAASGYYMVGFNITVENAHTVDLQNDIHIIIEEIGSLSVKGSGTVTVKAGSSLVVNGEFNIIENGSVNVYGELICNGKVNVSTGGMLNLGNGTRKPDNNPYDESGIDENAHIVIGKSGTCTVTSGKLKISTYVTLEGTLDLTTVDYTNGSLVPNYPGKVLIKSSGTMYMLEQFQAGDISNYTSPGNFIGTCEKGATIIYAEGGSNTAKDGTYVYNNGVWAISDSR